LSFVNPKIVLGGEGQINKILNIVIYTSLPYAGVIQFKFHGLFSAFAPIGISTPRDEFNLYIIKN